MFWRRGNTKQKAIAYQKLFNDNPEAEHVLYDLMEFCYMLKATGNERDEGRREVILYILHHLNINVSLLNKKIKKKTEEESRNESKEIDFSNTY